MKEKPNKYYTEEQLVHLLQSGTIDWVQYVELHSKEMKDDYYFYCKTHQLDKDSNNSAMTFLDDISEKLMAGNELNRLI